MPDPPPIDPKVLEPRQAVWQGIDLCRTGDWEGGLAVLRHLARQEKAEFDRPGRFFSYLGYGVARFESRYKEGVALCRHAIKIEPQEPENHLNLARIYLLRRNRRGAYKALKKGLALNPHHQQLLEFYEEFGRRRPAVLPFLPRGHRLNRILGRIRYRLFG